MESPEYPPHIAGVNTLSGKASGRPSRSRVKPSRRYSRWTRFLLSGPAFAPQHDPDAHVAEPWQRLRDLADPQAKRGHVARLRLVIPGIRTDCAPAYRRADNSPGSGRESTAPTPVRVGLRAFFATPPAGSDLLVECQIGHEALQARVLLADLRSSRTSATPR